MKNAKEYLMFYSKNPNAADILSAGQASP